MNRQQFINTKDDSVALQSLLQLMVINEQYINSQTAIFNRWPIMSFSYSDEFCWSKSFYVQRRGPCNWKFDNLMDNPIKCFMVYIDDDNNLKVQDLPCEYLD